MKLEITKEKVLEAASKCDTAKQTLKVLFPEAFVEKKLVFETHSLEKWICGEIDVSLYNRISGKTTKGKAEALADLILKTYPAK